MSKIVDTLVSEKSRKFSLEVNMPIMITLNLADADLSNKVGFIDHDKMNQHQTLEPRTRFKKCKKHYDDLNRRIGKYLKNWKSTIEISPCLNSKGLSKYPRIHSHIVGEVIDPIGLLLELGYVVNSLGCAYHIKRAINTKMEDDLEYIKKDAENWKAFNKRKNILKCEVDPTDHERIWE